MNNSPAPGYTAQLIIIYPSFMNDGFHFSGGQARDKVLAGQES